jgi:hypothetical protein
MRSRDERQIGPRGSALAGSDPASEGRMQMSFMSLRPCAANPRDRVRRGMRDTRSRALRLLIAATLVAVAALPASGQAAGWSTYHSPTMYAS